MPATKDGRLRCANIDIRYTTVSDLIDSEHYTWREDIVRDIADPIQVAEILAMPISCVHQLDIKI